MSTGLTFTRSCLGKARPSSPASAAAQTKSIARMSPLGRLQSAETFKVRALAAQSTCLQLAPKRRSA